ncbi:DUF1648 domain-containing protein [Blastococcus sp. KM273128]|uniref:DUF1648 domain-containing protein n=1 Tax=Blastococcus sp. KM273128 TaxID=2570314 RepID=UPI001F19CE19|nr:DUF1648 domain-containing protein [Blastococcus sp. KM273128]MCF6745929.1 DUF1648 domain-containing protein [Blastococcus sp. KM273128]
MGSGRSWFLAAAAACAAAWGWSLARLPERVPVHFGGAGEPDRWAGRAEALWTSGLLALGTALLFAGLVGLVGRVPAHSLNVPNPDYWKRPEHLPRLRALVAEDLWWIGAWTLLLFAAVQVLLVRAAQLPDPRLDGWAYAVLGLYLLAVLGRVGWMLTRRFAVPEPG